MDLCLQVALMRGALEKRNNIIVTALLVLHWQICTAEHIRKTVLVIYGRSDKAEIFCDLEDCF